MEIFEIDLKATSQSKDFKGIKTDSLEAEGFYGLFRIRFGDKSFGYYFEEIASKLHPQDDLYYWIEALLKAAICISETGYCAIADIEHPERLIEFVNHGSLVQVSVIKTQGSSDFIVKKPLLEKEIVVEAVEVDKHQMFKEIIDKANSFIASVMNMEPRFAETDQHKRIIDLVNKAGWLIA